MRTYTHPLHTFGDLLAFDLEATLSCRCSRHGTIDATSGFFFNRPLGGASFCCTPILPNGDQCNQRNVPHIGRRGREDWHLPDHWRAMMRRNPGVQPAPRAKTYRDLVHAGMIAWLGDTGCGGGYGFHMIAFDEPPWDRLLDEPLGAIVCPGCRKTMSMRRTCGGHGSGGGPTESVDVDDQPALRPRPPRFGEPIVIRGPA